MPATAMKERAFNCYQHEVSGILSGRQTQMRRIVKDSWQMLPLDVAEYQRDAIAKCPYGVPGDRLWVRETFYCDDYRYPDAPQDELLQAVEYKASHDCADWEAGCPCSDNCWRPSIHMPRWASRITLEITGVRVERLQEISEADALADGGWTYATCPFHKAPEKSFRELWHTIHKADGPHGWEANPWVWVIEFRRVESAG